MNKEDLKTLVEIADFIGVNYQNPQAFNFMEDGKWVHISSQEFAQKVKLIALALGEIGLGKGAKMGILSHPNPIWLMMDLAIISAGAVSVPIFPDIAPQNLKFEIADAEVQFVFCDNAESLQQLKNCGQKFSRIIIYDHLPSQLHTPPSRPPVPPSQRKLGSRAAPEIPAFAGMTEGKEENIIKFSDLLLIGEKIANSNPDLFSQLISNISENDLATIVYTSGSTGVPKGVEITHKNLISQIKGAAEFFPLFHQSDIALSFLPLAHIFERMVVSYYVVSGIAIYFAEDPKKIGDVIREIRPTLMTAVPRVLEKTYQKMKSGIEEKNILLKIIGRKAFNLALKRDVKNFRKSFMAKILDLLVYKKLRAALGGRFRMMICGGAALSVDMKRFFTNIGITLYVGYGTTESSPVIAANCNKYKKFGTVGKPFPDIEVKLNSKGELLARGPNIMLGYHNNPEKTREVLDENGWLNTGDLAQIDEEGYVKIIGRSKELFKTATGKYVSPVPIEQSILQGCEFLLAAAIIAEGRKFVSCLLFPDFDILGKSKNKFGMAGASDEEFLNSQKVNDRIAKLIDQVNSGLNHWEQIRKFYLVQDKISAETGELTPSMKLRRSVVEEKYKKVIDGFYEE